jgi:hypothetical protein
MILRSWRFGIPLGNQLPHNEILLQKPFLPSLQILQLVRTEILEIIQGSLQVLGEHILVEALERETAGGVAAGEVFVWSALLLSII